MQKRLILVASSGRCGTMLLSLLLDLVPFVDAVHEPKPLVGDIWWRLRQDPDLAERWLKQKKLPAIFNSLLYRRKTYIETGHLLCKGFFEPMLKLGVEFDLIILDRDPREIALSMFSLGDIPDRGKTGRHWYLSPSDVHNISKLPKSMAYDNDDVDWLGFSDYQMCYWYTLEMELRKAHYEKMFKESGRLVVRTSLSDLKDLYKFQHLLHALRLLYLSSAEIQDYTALCKLAVNAKNNRKAHLRRKKLVPPISTIKRIREQEIEIERLIKFSSLMQQYK